MPRMVALLNETDDKYMCFAHFVPTRIIRVTANVKPEVDAFKTFRVEQLVRTNRDNDSPTGTWRLLSLHSSDTPGLKLADAMLAAKAAQEKLISQLNERLPQRFPQTPNPLLRATS